MELFDRQLTPIEKKLKEFEEKLDELYKDEIPDLADLTVKQKIDLYQKYVLAQIEHVFSHFIIYSLVENIYNISNDCLGSSCAEDIFDFFSQIKPSYVEDFLEFAEYNDDIIDKCLVCISEGDLSTFTGLISSSHKSKRSLDKMYEKAIKIPPVIFKSDNVFLDCRKYAFDVSSEILQGSEKLDEVRLRLKETVFSMTNVFCQMLPPDNAEYLREKTESFIDTFPTDADLFPEWFYHTVLLFDYEIRCIIAIAALRSFDSLENLVGHLMEKILLHPAASELFEILQQESLNRKDDDVSDADSSPENAYENVPKESEKRAMLIPPTWLRDEHRKAIYDYISKNYLGGDDLGYFFGLEAWDKQNIPQGIKWNGTVATLHYFCKALYLGQYINDEFRLKKANMPLHAWEKIAEVFFIYINKDWQHPEVKSLQSAKKASYEEEKDSINSKMKYLFKEVEKINRSKQ